uniref:Uncharacterized protein n=1 Tax=Amphilophus citrinellus TaxID=61819 RepID=A0A3Q0S464_AMPCI
MGKQKDDLQKLGRSLGPISKQLQIPRSSVQTTACKYKSFRCVTTLRRTHSQMKGNWLRYSGPRTTNAQACHELETAGTLESLFTVNSTEIFSCPHGQTKCLLEKNFYGDVLVLTVDFLGGCQATW